jgi:hypothetical protein
MRHFGLLAFQSTGGYRVSGQPVEYFCLYADDYRFYRMAPVAQRLFLTQIEDEIIRFESITNECFEAISHVNNVADAVGESIF